MGGVRASAAHREFGYAQVRARGHSQLLRDIEDHTTPEGYGMLDVWMSHGDHVTQLPESFKVIASTTAAPIAGMADEARGFYGLQFHPEVTHTHQGARILQRFVHDICGCASLWTMSNVMDESIRQLREKVGSDEVLLALSGGVDSSVVAALLHKAIGKQLTCVFVDNGPQMCRPVRYPRDFILMDYRVGRSGGSLGNRSYFLEGSSWKTPRDCMFLA